jgi:hypothetical protein
MYIGIDLALRNIGIVKLNDDGTFKDCKLITSDPKKINDEELLIHNSMGIWSFLQDIKIGDEKEYVALEGLSFGSKSASIDLIAANHWMLRAQLKDESCSITVIPPKSWQKSIVTKEILAEWAKEWPVIRAKRGMKLTKDETKTNNKSKAEIRKKTKDYIYNSLPVDVRASINDYVKENKLKDDSVYDLADAYCIASHLRNKNG